MNTDCNLCTTLRTSVSCTTSSAPIKSLSHMQLQSHRHRKMRLLPTPGGPCSNRLDASATKASVASSLTCLSSIDGWKPKSNFSRVRLKDRCARCAGSQVVLLLAATSAPSRMESIAFGTCPVVPCTRSLAIPSHHASVCLFRSKSSLKRTAGQKLPARTSLRSPPSP